MKEKEAEKEIEDTKDPEDAHNSSTPRGQQREREKDKKQRRGESEARTVEPLKFSLPLTADDDAQLDYPREGAAGEEEMGGQPRKQPRQYLKRKSQKITAGTVKWGKVSTRVDCWKAKPNESVVKQSEKKRLLVRESAEPRRKKRPQPQNRSKDLQGQSYGRRSDAQFEHRPTHAEPRRGRPRNPPRNPQQERADKLTVHQLNDLYIRCHGDGQGTSIVFS